MKKLEKILHITSIIITIIATIIFTFLWIEYHNSYLNANGEDTYKIALVVILLALLIYGSIAYGISALINVVLLIIYNRRNKNKNKDKNIIIRLSSFIAIPVLIEVIIFLAFYLHP